MMREGDKVNHVGYGVGRIESFIDHETVLVQFDSAEQRQLDNGYREVFIANCELLPLASE